MSISPPLKSRIEARLSIIQSGNFTKEDVELLLHNVRPLLPKPKLQTAIRDIADFFAHQEGRNQGVAHAKIKRTVQRMIDEAFRGALPDYSEANPPYTVKEIIDGLVKYLEGSGISFDQTRLLEQSKKMIGHIAELIEGTPILLSIPEVKSAIITGVQRLPSGGFGLCLRFTFEFEGLERNISYLLLLLHPSML